MKVHFLQRAKWMFRGTASREDWWVSMLGAVMFALILYFGKILVDGVQPSSSRWSAAVVFAFCATVWIPVSMRRLRDLGASPRWVLLGWVPVANLVLFALLGTRKAGAEIVGRTRASTAVHGQQAPQETLTSGRRGAAGRASENERN